MKLIAVKVHVVTESGKIPTIIKLTAKFEDVVENCSAELTLNDLIHVNSEDIPTVSNEIDRITLEHPFFRLKLCESPIELKFFVYAMYKIPNLKPQVVIDQYRVDLAILEKRVAIELDGHEFHKSREDRTRDAKRERYLQRHGWQVIRFTGTEIHNDVFQCIDEAIQIVQKYLRNNRTFYTCCDILRWNDMNIEVQIPPNTGMHLTGIPLALHANR